jgi:hypothetical protein
LALTLAATCAHADPCLNLPELGGEVNKLVKDAAPVVRLEAGIGVSKFTGQHDQTTWYEQDVNGGKDDFPYKFDLTSPNFSVGVVAKVTDKTKIHAGYKYVGKVTSWARASASDQNYFDCRYDTSKCWPLSTWYGKGTVQELYLTASHDFKVGRATLIGEAGVTAYRPTWTETIPDWRPGPDAPTQFVRVDHNPKIQYGGLLGAGIKINDTTSLMFELEKHYAGGDDVPAVYKGVTRQVILKHEF